MAVVFINSNILAFWILLNSCFLFLLGGGFARLLFCGDGGLGCQFIGKCQFSWGGLDDGVDGEVEVELTEHVIF